MQLAPFRFLLLGVSSLLGCEWENASLDLSSILCSSSNCFCCILDIPDRSRFYAEGELLARLSILCVHLRTDDWSDVIRT
jgi:hypothetical protein